MWVYTRFVSSVQFGVGRAVEEDESEVTKNVKIGFALHQFNDCMNKTRKLYQ